MPGEFYIEGKQEKLSLKELLDRIAELAGENISELSMILLSLELKGIIKQIPGAKYIRI